MHLRLYNASYPNVNYSSNYLSYRMGVRSAKPSFYVATADDACAAYALQRLTTAK